MARVSWKECELYALAKADWETAGQAESAAMDTAMQLAALEAVVPNLSSPVAARLDKQAAIKEKVANAQAAVRARRGCRAATSPRSICVHMEHPHTSGDREWPRGMTAPSSRSS